MLDVRNRDLAQVTRPDDFVVSDRLVSLILSQISENKALGAVFTDLFDPEGSEVYLKPAGDYVELGEPLNFYTVVEAARQRSEVALGYRRHADAGDATRDYEVVVNLPSRFRSLLRSRIASSSWLKSEAVHHARLANSPQKQFSLGQHDE